MSKKRTFLHKPTNREYTNETSSSHGRVISENFYYQPFDGVITSVPKSIVESGGCDWQEIEEPIFVTKDEISIYDDNTILYWVDQKNLDTAGEGRVKNLTSSLKDERWLFFSSKEVMDRYIWENKPVLSMKDVKDYIARKQTEGKYGYFSTIIGDLSRIINKKLDEKNTSS